MRRGGAGAQDHDLCEVTQWLLALWVQQQQRGEQCNAAGHAFGANVIFMTAVLQECGPCCGSSHKGKEMLMLKAAVQPLLKHLCVLILCRAPAAFFVCSEQFVTSELNMHIQFSCDFKTVLSSGASVRVYILSKACCDTEQGACGGSAPCVRLLHGEAPAGFKCECSSLDL